MFDSMSVELAQWKQAVSEAAVEIARYALNLESTAVGEPIHGSAFADAIGAHIPLVGGPRALDLAVVTSPEGCAALARAMLMLPPGHPITDAEVADAVGELVNMLAGGVKRRMHARGTDLELGLPKFIHGHVQPTERLSVIGLPTTFGDIKTHVLIIGRKI